MTMTQKIMPKLICVKPDCEARRRPGCLSFLKMETGGTPVLRLLPRVIPVAGGASRGYAAARAVADHARLLGRQQDIRGLRAVEHIVALVTRHGRVFGMGEFRVGKPPLEYHRLRDLRDPLPRRLYLMAIGATREHRARNAAHGADLRRRADDRRAEKHPLFQRLA